MYLMYADESGNTETDLDNKQQPIFVLGSVLVPDNYWHEIIFLLDDRKKQIYSFFKDKEIHTNEIFNSKKDSYFRKNDWHKNLNILEQLVKLVSSLPLEFQYVTIDKQIYKKDIKKQYGQLVKIDPYLYAFSQLYKSTCERMRQQKTNTIIFLDKLIKFDKQILDFFPTINSRYGHNVIEYPLFLDSDSTNYIQIADMLSFYVNKYYCIKNGYTHYGEEKEKHCIAMFEKFTKNTITSIKNF